MYGYMCACLTVWKIDKIILHYHIMLRIQGNLQFKNTCSDGYIISVIDVIAQMRHFCNILESRSIARNTHVTHFTGSREDSPLVVKFLDCQNVSSMRTLMFTDTSLMPGAQKINISLING